MSVFCDSLSTQYHLPMLLNRSSMIPPKKHSFTLPKIEVLKKVVNHDMDDK